MGKKGSWFTAVKKAFSPDSKEKKAKRAEQAKKKLLGKENPPPNESSNAETIEVSHPNPLPPLEDVKLHDEHNNKQAPSVAVATSARAEAAVVASQAASETVRLTAVSKFSGKFKEEVAAIKVQTAFRGYLARRALRALRGLVRLKSLVDGPTVKRQTANTLKCMQTLSHVHSQIQSRRIRMSEENRTVQRQILQKRAQELETLKMGEEWDDSFQSKEKIEANLLQKYEAANRRERALAYSYSHQQNGKKSSRSTNLLFMDPTNPQWGWSWLDRWMAARPWEPQTTADKNVNNQNSSIGEITKSFTRHQLNLDSPSSPTRPKPRNSPATSGSKPARKFKPASPRGSAISQDDDCRSTLSVQSINRRHSIAGSSVRDDESLTGSQSVPSYMAQTRSAKAKSRLPSPLGMENDGAKKRLSFPPSPARPRRHSGPPKVDTSSIVDVSPVVS